MRKIKASVIVHRCVKVLMCDELVWRGKAWLHEVLPQSLQTSRGKACIAQDITMHILYFYNCCSAYGLSLLVQRVQLMNSVSADAKISRPGSLCHSQMELQIHRWSGCILCLHYSLTSVSSKYGPEHWSCTRENVSGEPERTWLSCVMNAKVEWMQGVIYTRGLSYM